MKSGENIIHHDSDRTPSTFKANKTEKIVMANKFIHISNTVSPIHETISFNVKNISLLKLPYSVSSIGFLSRLFDKPVCEQRSFVLFEIQSPLHLYLVPNHLK